MLDFLMRIFIIIISLLISFPALAQVFGNYENARYGASAKVPSGFEPTGPEAKNSDGLIFRNSSGALLTIFGADLPNKNFEAFVRKQISFEKSYHGWSIAKQTITPDWAHYFGNIGSRFVSVKIISSCNGKQMVATKFEYNGNMSGAVSKVEKSLKANKATSCR